MYYRGGEKGREPTVDLVEVAHLAEDEKLGMTAIARHLGGDAAERLSGAAQKRR